MRSISWFERYSVLNIYSKKSLIILTGFCSGSLLIFILLFFLYPIIKFLNFSIKLYLDLYIYLILFGFAGMMSSLVVLNKVKEEWENYGLYNYRDIFSYWLFFIVILVSGSIIFSNIPDMPIMYVWFGPIIFALILSDFLRYLYQSIHFRMLMIFFRKDYECIINEKKFKDYLRLKFSEIKRYGGPFSVIAIAIDNREKIIKDYGNKIWIKLNYDIITSLEQNIRETDIFGRIANGTILISFANTSKENIPVIGSRMLNIIRSKTFIYKDNIIKTTISLGIGILDSKFKNPEDVINAAINAINKACEKGHEQIVCNDGEFTFVQHD